MGKALERAFIDSGKTIGEITDNPAGGAGEGIILGEQAGKKGDNQETKEKEILSKSSARELRYQENAQKFIAMKEDGQIASIQDGNIVRYVPKTREAENLLIERKQILNEIAEAERQKNKEPHAITIDDFVGGERSGKDESVAISPDLEKSASEVKNISRERDSIRDAVEVASERKENEELSTRELVLVLLKDLESLRSEIERLNKAVAAAELSKNASDLEKPTESQAIEGGDVLENMPQTEESTVLSQPRAVGWAGVSEASKESVNEDTAPENGENTGEDGAEEEEYSTEEEGLEERRNKFLILCADSRNIIFGRPSEEDINKARAEYAEVFAFGLQEEARKAVLESGIEATDEEKEKMINENIRYQYLGELLKQNDLIYEMGSRKAEKSFPKKIHSWLKQNPKLRMILGLSLAGVAVASLAFGNAPLAAGALGARAALAGIGSGIFTEAVIDTFQKKRNLLLRNFTEEDLTSLTSDELSQIKAVIVEHDASRGVAFKDSKFKETLESIFLQQSENLLTELSAIEREAGSTDIARTRKIEEMLNIDTRKIADSVKDERNKKLVRGALGATAGLATFLLSSVIGKGSLAGDGLVSTESIGSPVEAEVSAQPPIEATPVPESLVTPSTGEVVHVVQSGEHIWGISEQNLKNLADSMGYELNPNQMEAAIDRAKDWYVANGYGSGPNNWLSVGDRIPFESSRGQEWLRYGIENPKL